MISKFFYGTGLAIIIFGATFSVLALMGATQLDRTFSLSPLIISIFSAMLYFAIGKALDLLQRSADSTEKIYKELVKQKNS